MINIFGLTLHELENLFENNNIKKIHAKSLYKRVMHFPIILPASNQWEKYPDYIEIFINNNLSFSLPKIYSVNQSSDLTTKFLFEYEDKNTAETVLIPFAKRFSICLSSQIGCAMKCAFCATGIQGLKRNLEKHEIVGQYIVARNYHYENSIKKVPPSIVFMGQGEPLQNDEAVKNAIYTFLDKQGIHLGPKQITLSTVGLTTYLKNFIDFPPINIAFSLHAPNQELREKIIPTAKYNSLSDIFSILNELSLTKKQFINCEYLLIKDFNDGLEHARQLVELVKPYQKIIFNLIPFNPFPGIKLEKPNIEKIEAFKQYLVQHKYHAKIRTTKGDAILAACGQLQSKSV